MPVNALDPKKKTLLRTLSEKQDRIAEDIQLLTTELTTQAKKDTNAKHKRLLANLEKSDAVVALKEQSERIATNRTYEAACHSRMCSEKLRTWSAHLDKTPDSEIYTLGKT